MRAPRVVRIGPVYRVEVGDTSYSPSGAREAAAVLVAAADEADRRHAEDRVAAMPPGAGRFVARLQTGEVNAT